MTTYERGFMDKCAELGVNPDALVKAAQMMMMPFRHAGLYAPKQQPKKAPPSPYPVRPGIGGLGKATAPRYRPMPPMPATTYPVTGRPTFGVAFNPGAVRTATREVNNIRSGKSHWENPADRYEAIRESPALGDGNGWAASSNVY